MEHLFAAHIVGGFQGKQTPPSKLSAEEQLAMDEEELKQEDWDHQLC